MRFWPLVLVLAACEQKPTVPFAQARQIVDVHCVSCHSENPTNRAFPIAPASVRLDTDQEMQQWAERIRVRTCVDKTMPLLNRSNMTEEERTLIDKWIEGGARIQ